MDNYDFNWQKSGFSLLETLICLTISSIFILNINVFTIKYNHQILDSISKDIVSAVRFAKFLAIIRGENLVLKCANHNNCSSGLNLYAAISLTPKLKNNNETELIKTWRWPNNKNKIFWHGFNDNELVFTQDIKHNAANGKFHIFYKDKPYITLIVNKLGKVRVEKETS